jgi:hypothetical protein
MDNTLSEMPSKRRVYYLGGFDPRGAGYYYKLFGSQANKMQDQTTEIKRTPRKKTEGCIFFWQTSLTKRQPASQKKITIETTHFFMGWDDIIRAHWSKSVMQLILSFFACYLNRNSWASLNSVRRCFKPALYAGVFPLIFFILYLTTILTIIAPLNASLALSFSSNSYTLAAAISDAIIILLITTFFYSAANRVGILWLLRIYRFNILFAEGKVKEVQTRQQEWVEKIIDHQIHDPADEIIFSAHSVGTLLLVGVIDALLADERWKNLQPTKKMCVLTLGQCYPFVTPAPSAAEFRKSLQRICESDGVLWLDVTAQIDPLCFHGMHPLQNTDLFSAKLQQPILHGARFFKMYSPERWKEIKKNKILVHFLYLMTPEKSFGFNLYDIFYGVGRFEDKVLLLTDARKKI